MPKRRLVIIALLRVFRFQMNFYSGQSRFVEDKKRKEKKGEEIPNLKTHVEAIRNSMVKSCGMKRPRILLGIRFHNFFFHIQNATVFSFSRSFPFPSFFHSFFVSLDPFFFFFFFFFFFCQDDENRDVSSRNDFSRLINRMALSLGDSYNRFSYTH